MLNAYILGTWTCFVSDSSAHLYRYSVEVNDCAVKCVCVCLGVSIDEKWKRRKKLCVNIYIFYCLYLCGVPSSLHSCANVKWHNLKCVDFRSIFRRRRRNVVHATNLNAIVCNIRSCISHRFRLPLDHKPNERLSPFFPDWSARGNEYGENIERFATGLRLHWGMSIQSIKYRHFEWTKNTKKIKTFSWHRYGCVPATHPCERDGARDESIEFVSRHGCAKFFSCARCARTSWEREDQRQNKYASLDIRTNTCRKGARLLIR